MKIAVFFFALVLLGQPALAVEKIISTHCKKHGVPTELALAVAKQESSLNPLCINVEGCDYTPKNRAEAEAIIRKAHAANKSFDVGVMQINSQWVRQWKIDPVDLLDPETNVRYGIKLLKDEIQRHGLNWRAVGGYHSPNPLRGRQYAFMVGRRIKGNAELKSMLANPRLGVFRIPGKRLGTSGLASKRFRKLQNFQPLEPIHIGDLGQPHTQRLPVGVSQARR